MLIQKSDDNSIELTSSLLKEEKIVIIPTDTVYGFSGVIFKTEKKILNIKGRAESKGLIGLIAEPEDIFKYSDSEIPQTLLQLWPAPLTLVVKQKNSKNSLAFRCPADAWLRELIRKTGEPIYSTSVNYTGHPLLTEIADIKKEFESKVSVIVCAENSALQNSGLASTIVSVLDGEIKILRQGSFKIN